MFFLPVFSNSQFVGRNKSVSPQAVGVGPAGGFKLNVVAPAAELEKMKPKLAPMYSAVHCSAYQCTVKQCSAVQGSTVQCSSVSKCTIVLKGSSVLGAGFWGLLEVEDRRLAASFNTAVCPGAGYNTVVCPNLSLVYSQQTCCIWAVQQIVSGSAVKYDIEG